MLILKTILYLILSQSNECRTGVIWQNLDVLHTTRANEFCTRCNCFMYFSSTIKSRELQQDGSVSKERVCDQWDVSATSRTGVRKVGRVCDQLNGFVSSRTGV